MDSEVAERATLVGLEPLAWLERGRLSRGNTGTRPRTPVVPAAARSVLRSVKPLETRPRS